MDDRITEILRKYDHPNLMTHAHGDIRKLMVELCAESQRQGRILEAKFSQAMVDSNMSLDGRVQQLQSIEMSGQHFEKFVDDLLAPDMYGTQ